MSTEMTIESKQGAVIGGWVCLVLATILMFFDPFAFLIYGPLFLASFILGIIAITQRKLFNGLMILSLTIFIPPFFIYASPIFLNHSIRTPILSENNSTNSHTSMVGSSKSEVTKTEAVYDNNDYDIKGYCQKVAQIAGGSYQIENFCRDQEYEAYNRLSRMQVSEEIRNYCNRIGKTAGGSYQLMESCVQQETEAKRAISNSTKQNQSFNLGDEIKIIVPQCWKIQDKSGMMGLIEFSQAKYKELRQKPNIQNIEKCVAVDLYSNMVDSSAAKIMGYPEGSVTVEYFSVDNFQKRIIPYLVSVGMSLEKSNEYINQWEAAVDEELGKIIARESR